MINIKFPLRFFLIFLLLKTGLILAQNPQEDRIFGRKTSECTMGTQHNNFYVTNAVFYDDGGELGNVGRV